MEYFFYIFCKITFITFGYVFYKALMYNNRNIQEYMLIQNPRKLVKNYFAPNIVHGKYNCLQCSKNNTNDKQIHDFSHLKYAFP